MRSCASLDIVSTLAMLATSAYKGLRVTLDQP